MKIILVSLLAFALAGTVAREAPARSSWPCSVNGVSAGGFYWTGIVNKSVRTSCPFARSVMRAATSFIIRAGGAGNGDFYVRAYSPVTLRYYLMHCEADGNIRDDVFVDCRGGIGARVSYHAHVR